MSKLAFDAAAFRHGLSQDEIVAAMSDLVYVEREFQPARKGEGMNTLIIGRHPSRDELVEVVMRTDTKAMRATVFHAMTARWKMLARIEDPTVIPAQQLTAMNDQLRAVGLDRHQPGSRAMKAQLDVLEQRLQERRSGIDRHGLDRVADAINQMRANDQQRSTRYERPSTPGPDRPGPQL